MRYPAIVSLFTVLFSVNILANDLDSSLKKAINYLFNFQFEKAEKELLIITKTQKNNTRAWLLLSNLYLWKFLSDQNKSDLEKFEYYANETINRANKLLKTNSNDLDVNYSITSIYGYKAFSKFFNKNYFEGLWYTKKSIDLTNDILSKNKYYYDAYFWQGMFNVFLSQIPKSIQKVLNIFNLSGNLIKGIEELELARAKSMYAKTEASYLLSQIYSSLLEENTKAYSILDELARSYSENELFKYSLAAELMKLNRTQEAKLLLLALYNKSNFKLKTIKSFTLFLLGDCHFYCSESNEAIKYYSLFLKYHSENNYKPTAMFRLAYSFLMLNDSTQANRYFSKLSTINSKNGEDKFYKRITENYLIGKYLNHFIDLILAANSIRCGNYESAISILQRVELNSLDIRSMTNYYIGLAYYYNGNISNASTYFLKNLYIKPENEKWTKAFSIYFLAKIELEKKNLSQASYLFKMLSKIKNYDFESYLTLLVKNIKTINKLNSQ